MILWKGSNALLMFPWKHSGFNRNSTKANFGTQHELIYLFFFLSIRDALHRNLSCIWFFENNLILDIVWRN